MSSQSGSSDDLDTWEYVSRVSGHEPDDSDSDSSIEVVSIDTDTECELATPSSPSLVAPGSINPVFILRVPSTEADDLSAESDESADDGDGTSIMKDLQVVCHRQDMEISSVGGERSDTAHGTDAIATTQGSKEKDTTDRSDETDTTDRSDETDTEHGFSVDLSSSNVSVTSSVSSDTDHTEDTCTSKKNVLLSNSQSVDDDDSHLVRTAGSMKAPSSLSDEHSLVDTTLTEEDNSTRTDEDNSLNTDEDSSSRTEEDNASRTESMMATPLPSLPDLPMEPDIFVAVIEPVESSKPPSDTEEDQQKGGDVPDNAEVEKGHIDDDEETNIAVLGDGDSTVESQEGYSTEVVQPQIENLNPRSPSNNGDERTEILDPAEISAESSLASSVTAEMTDSELIGKTPGNAKYVSGVIIVIASLCGCIIGINVGAFWNTSYIKIGLEARRELASIQEQLSDRDSYIDFQRRSLDWMTENASFDLEKLQTTNTELVFDPAFAAGYEYRYYLFTFGKFSEKNKELIRRDELTMEQIKHSNSLEWMDKVNRLEQEKADLIQQIGRMRYGSPPNAGPVTSGNQAPDQADVGEQDFTWFTPGEQPDGDAEHFRSAEEEEAFKQNDKIATLESDLLLEKAQSEMWQSLYLQQKDSSDSTLSSGKEILKQFSQLLQNFSVPEDFSENVKENWEALKNQSFEGWQLIMDVASMMTSGTTQQDDIYKTEPQDDIHQTEQQDDIHWTTEEDIYQTEQQDDIHWTTEQDKSKSEPLKDDWNFDSESDEEYVDTDEQKDSSSDRNQKRALPKWSETIQDVYNKTKSSVSDVSQQIKDTWEQVKNLSKDLWEEHEPSVTKLKEKMSKKVEKVSEKLSAWFKRRRWSGNNKRHTRKTQQNGNDEESSQTGSTKRRSFTKEKEEEKDKYWSSDNKEEEEGESDDEDDEEDWGNSESVLKRYRRRFRKLRKNMDKLNLRKFMQLNVKHIRRVFKKIEKFVQKIDLQVLSAQNRKWLTCQQGWWFSIYTNVNMDPNCRDVLPCWQVSLVTGGNPHTCDGSHANDPHIKRQQQKGDRNRKHCNKNNRDQKRRGDQEKQQFRGNQHPTSDQLYQDEKNRREEEEYNDTDTKPRPTDKSLPFCDPASGDCPTTEPSWYIQQLKHREDMRNIVGEESESASESEWMFTRAEERDFQRTLPDDWYSRRLDSSQDRDNDYFDYE